MKNSYRVRFGGSNLMLEDRIVRAHTADEAREIASRFGLVDSVERTTTADDLEQAEARAESVVDASEEYQAILREETGHTAPDARRCLRDERMALHVALQSGDQSAIHRAAVECRRVRLMWEGR